MKKKLIVIILLHVFTGYFSKVYSQNDFLKKSEKTVRAYSYPMGSISTKEIIGSNSKTYKVESPKFSKKVIFTVTQSDYKKKGNKLADHCLFDGYYNQGESAFFAIIINEDKNKYFISIPNKLIGQLNFEHNQDEEIKYIHIEASTNNNDVFLFYIDSKDGKIENKITKNKQPIKISNESDLNSIISKLDKFYLINYKYK